MGVSTSRFVNHPSERLAPVALLMEELKNDDIQLRLNSIRNLGRIASGMGVERTQQELLPFLQGKLLCALEEHLNGFDASFPFCTTVLFFPSRSLTSRCSDLVRFSW
jgi:hypothetical protein